MKTLCALALLSAAQLPVGRIPRPLDGHVLVVGGQGGYPQIQAAVAAAQDGDALLVRSGSYSGFSIVDKGLLVVADAGATVSIQGPVSVDSLSPNKSVLLAGLVVHGSSAQPAGSAAFSAQNDAGSVRIEECTILGADASSTTAGQVGLSLDSDADVALSACTIQGGHGLDAYQVVMDGGAGGLAVSADASSVAVHDSVLRGGDGGSGGWGHIDPGGDGGRGGAAYRLDEGFVFVAGSDLYGGAGGPGGNSGPCLGGGYPGAGGAGGPGVRAIGASPPHPNLALLGNQMFPGNGGAGGVDTSGVCYGDGPPGANGSAVSAPPGTVESFAGTSRRFSAPRVARENTIVAMPCQGQPGDVVQVFAAPAPAFAFQENQHGVALTNLSQARLVASGTIPGSGTLILSIGLSSSGHDAKPIYFQAYFRDPTNQRFVATPATLVELDAAF
jgi:hypothetical protein